MGWPVEVRRSLIAVAVLASLVSVKPVGAQEPIGPEPTMVEPAPGASEADQRGPRVPTDWRSLEPRVRREPTPSFRTRHTIVLSTLALVVVVVLLVLLLS